MKKALAEPSRQHGVRYRKPRKRRYCWPHRPSGHTHPRRLLPGTIMRSRPCPQTGFARRQSSNLATRSRWRASRPELAAATWPQTAQARAPDKAKARGKSSWPRPRQAGPLYPKEDGDNWLKRKAPLGKRCHVSFEGRAGRCARAHRACTWLAALIRIRAARFRPGMCCRATP
jgi:hypothetical protein